MAVRVILLCWLCGLCPFNSSAFAASETSEIPDITSEGSFCSEVGPSSIPLDPIVKFLKTDRRLGAPWIVPPILQRMSSAEQQDVTNLWTLSHDLNSQYIRSIGAGLKAKIDLAQVVGVDLTDQLRRLPTLRKECEVNDINERNFAPEFAAASVAMTMASKAPAKEHIEDYFKMFVLALLENYRLERVLMAGLKRTPVTEELQKNLKGVVLRLFVLRQRFPFLQNVSWSGESGSKLSVRAVDLLMFSTYSPTAVDESVYFSSDEYDGVFGYNALPCQALKGSAEADVRKLYPFRGEYKGREYFPFVYRRVIEGQISIPQELVGRLVQSLKSRIKQSLDSLELKCTSGPCSTIAIRPEEAAAKMQAEGSLPRLKGFVCSCQIDRDTQTIPNWLNYTIGLSGAGLGIGCILSGAGAVICPLAFYSIVMDMGIGLAGIYDAEMNDRVVGRWAVGRTDAVPAEEDYETRQRVRKNTFEYDYNYLTGLFSFLPYKINGRTTYRMARVLSALLHDPAVTTVALLESVKAASSIPVPQLRVNSLEAIRKLDRNGCR